MSASAWLAVWTLAMPLGLFLLLGLSQLLNRPLAERLLGRIAMVAMSSAVLAALAAWLLSLSQGAGDMLDLGGWFRGSGTHFSLALQLNGDTLAALAFANLLVGVVEAFTQRYLHREPGYHRFQLMLFLFLLGLDLVSMAASMEMLLAGWECLGLSSALLIAFFHERVAPLSNGLRVFIIYRFCDLALVTALLLLRTALPADAPSPWQAGQAPLLDRGTAEAVLCFLWLAVCGKSALFPFSSWLPRAMEGPTPSSAIFYGALSVHAGPLLLLRFPWLLEQAPTMRGVLIVSGLLTSLMATLVARAQTDIKSLLAYATVTQVGLILVEIALGFHLLPMLHIAGHATLRSLQFLRSPSLLHDRHNLEDAVGGHLAHARLPFLDRLSERQALGLYRFALHRAWLDAWLEYLCLRPWRGLTAAALAMQTRWEAAWTKRFGGEGE